MPCAAFGATQTGRWPLQGYFFNGLLSGGEIVDVWDEFLLLVYGLPPAIVVGTALSAKLAARLMDKPLGWGKAFAIGVATFMIGFAGLLVHWLLKR